MSPNYLTTGDVARLAGVSSRTVGQWCDDRLVDHFKLPAGDRRISRAAVIGLLRRLGAGELPAELTGSGVVLVGLAESAAESLLLALVRVGAEFLDPALLPPRTAPCLAAAAHLIGQGGIRHLLLGHELAASPEADALLGHLRQAEPGTSVSVLLPPGVPAPAGCNALSMPADEAGWLALARHLLSC